MVEVLKLGELGIYMPALWAGAVTTILVGWAFERGVILLSGVATLVAAFLRGAHHGATR